MLLLNMLAEYRGLQRQTLLYVAKEHIGLVDNDGSPGRYPLPNSPRLLGLPSLLTVMGADILW
jgi:hypothetical protein